MLAKSVEVILIASLCLGITLSVALPSAGREVGQTASTEIGKKQVGEGIKSSPTPLTKVIKVEKRSPSQEEGMKEEFQGGDEEYRRAKEGEQRANNAFKRGLSATYSQQQKGIPLQTQGTSSLAGGSKGGDGKNQKDASATGNQSLTSSADTKRDTRQTQGDNVKEGKDSECCGAQETQSGPGPSHDLDKRDTVLSDKDGNPSGESCKECCGAEECNKKGSA